MVEIGVFHNGGTNLPIRRTSNGQTIPDASIREVHADNQKIVTDQITHLVLADKHGFDRGTFTEHHFEITGAEYSTNPLLSQMAVAAQTDEIRLCQMANIINWHDPVRFAEQIGILDTYSDGRVEAGIGRGYQPREAEVLGQTWGGTVQDEERNRRSFQEKYDIIRAIWTGDRVTYSGANHQIPPDYTRWHHPQDYAYLADDVTDASVSDYIDWIDVEDEYASDSSNVVMSNRSTLTAISVFPRPVQDPHPQLWMPVTSTRSVEWTAKHGVNPYVTTGTPSMIRGVAETYYEAAKSAGWPDHRPEFDGEPFDYGWDADRRRGITLRKSIFNTEIADDDVYERWKLGIEHRWGYLAAWGFDQALLSGTGHDELSTQTLLDFNIAIAGSSDDIIEQLIQTRDEIGMDDLSIDCQFEIPGITASEADAQLEAFASDVMPTLREKL